ncbi:DUF4412 domain-containing protein [Acetobacter conturbans]|uniref:DUF4412 domain-containing protein n=1 Tax=Acetobacter conturbans TaxID=1737472 RepID=A0ABX0JX21_9PROT|nr:DUF4412 domain-containing protein [Acetobacter conturbans]NHN87806.1 DUF4412 domain-containing protein [Acetobacter conturbans]
MNARGQWKQRLVAGLAVGMMLGASAACAAEGDHPPLMPLKDAVVTYDVQPDGAPQAQQVKVWFTAEGARMRIDSPDGSASTILNRTTQAVTILLHKQRVYSRLEQRGGIRNPFLLDVSMQFHKHGTQNIAGIACTEWDVTSGQGQATACVTSDGLILAESGVDADGAKGKLTATSVSYQTIPSATFEPPSDYQEVVRRRVSGGGGDAQAPALGPNAGTAPQDSDAAGH